MGRWVTPALAEHCAGPLSQIHSMWQVILLISYIWVPENLLNCFQSSVLGCQASLDWISHLRSTAWLDQPTSGCSWVSGQNIAVVWREGWGLIYLTIWILYVFSFFMSSWYVSNQEVSMSFWQGPHKVVSLFSGVGGLELGISPCKS